jgi:hypothetical protein
MNMTNRKLNQNGVEEPRTRYFILTKYEREIGGYSESNDAADSIKNFPGTFIPMTELEEISSE